jgi:hypothetical protein
MRSIFDYAGITEDRGGDYEFGVKPMYIITMYFNE